MLQKSDCDYYDYDYERAQLHHSTAAQGKKKTTETND
jgi:hypothetical protein